MLTSNLLEICREPFNRFPNRQNGTTFKQRHRKGLRQESTPVDCGHVRAPTPNV
jgi:hypothetical protein